MPLTRNAAKALTLRLAAITLLGIMAPNASAGQADPAQGKWPANGIAQRSFPNGLTLFVEDDHGTRRAWVVSDSPDRPNVEAMDFFTGERLKVKVELEDDGRQTQSFTDSRGINHVSVGRGYAFSAGTGLSVSLPGIDLQAGSVYIKKSPGFCGSQFTAATPKDGGALAWQKFAIYRNATPNSVCSKGFYEANITTALDLDDGTFLAVEDCFVFRLRKSDLSPVGEAPSLRIVDRTALEGAVAEAKAKGDPDTMGYVAKVLGLPTAPELACKEQ